ncbi:dimethyl sulfoxide reductase anchor subunit family protein [Desulfosporosinus hippei]|uniref:Anaerobic dimethyl sulfoxide reductase subunit C (DMSO reductase anchor subunit) n=1 Tax=Desulfosporosinus hippei DSM 8344 TaxID=1121419 RepID=A0A1G7ZAB5_9FIRM|nr:DmsC/YnfH family molybdoenzyme membrane anchor subunit [Desulfosporosinus hippei]SDH05476.1 anaerobic dimethyl sulfoxide reductase subunit C (DMSO reductase anchor subunit) [Desulfosporosinus hippei DSM 8344]
MDETALLIFTLCLQAAIGSMIFITLGKQLYKDKQFKVSALISACLSVVGVLASFVHLGQPFSALNSLSNLGSSWLSKEALLAGIFMGITVLYAWVQYYRPESQGLNTVLRWAGSVLGLVTIFSMVKVYTMASVPVWDGTNTFVDFYATAIALGALIFLVSSFKELNEANQRLFPFIVLATVVIQVAAAVPYAFSLGLNGMAAQASAEVLSEMGVVIALKWLLILGGAGLLLWPAIQKAGATGAKSASGIIYVAAAILLIGEIIGRYVFYASMITSHIGLT